MKVVITLAPYFTIDDFDSFEVTSSKVIIHSHGGKIITLPLAAFVGLCFEESSIWEQSKFNKGGNAYGKN